MKRLFSTAALLLVLSMAASAQSSATNGVVTLTPFRGSTSIVPGAAIAATFNDPSRTWHDGTQGYQNQPALKYKYIVTAQPNNIQCYVVQVEPTRLWFFLNSFTTGATSISISLQDPANPIVGKGTILWTEVIPLTVVRAAPVLTGAGQWYSFTDARLHEFSAGGFVLPRNGLRFDLVLFLANAGNLSLWVVEIQQNGVTVFEALALIDFANQARPQDNLQLIAFPQLPVGAYQVRAYALDDPTLISPPITLTIQ